MTTGDSDNPAAPGPGLEGDLLAELDEWDRTFDALHADDGLFGGGRAATPPPPAPAPAPTAAFDENDEVTRTVSLTGLDAVLDDPGFDAPTTMHRPAAFDAPTTLRRPPAPAFDDVTVMTAAPTAPPVAVVPQPRRIPPRTTPPPPPRARAATSPPPAAIDETDFSDLGFSGPPEALGTLLGQPPPLPPLEDVGASAALAAFEEDEVLTSAVRPGAVMTITVDDPDDDDASGDDPVSDDPFAPSADELAQLRRAAHQSGVEETRVASPTADLFESDETMDRGAASRRRAEPRELDLADQSDDSFDGANQTRILDPDDELLADAGKRAVRTGPAIVRRDQPRQRPASTGGFGGGESTRVADLRELEKLARRRTDEPRQARPTPSTGYVPPPDVVVDEDFYADIEIGNDDDDTTGTLAAARRVTSNVVRRASDSPALAPTLTPAAAHGDGRGEPEIQITRGPAPVAAPPVAAAAVDDDLGLDAAMAEFAEPDRTPVGGAVRVPAPASASAPVLAPAAPVAAPAAAEPAPEVAVAAPEVATAAAPEVAVPAEPAPAELGQEAAAPDVEAPDVGAVASAAAAPVDAEAGFDDLEFAFAEPVVDPPSAPALWSDDAASQTKIGVPPPPLAIPEAARASASPTPVASSSSGPVARPRASTEAPIGRPVVVEPAAGPALAEPIAATAPPAVLETSPVAAALPPAVFGTALPPLDLDQVRLPEQSDAIAGYDPGEAAARGILRIERELELIDEPALQAGLRVEAGRLYERLGDAERARGSYEAALLADPRATAALRGLRRIARGVGDLAEATTHLDAELGIAGPLERRALALHRVDLLMAAGEEDLARVAVGELLDEAKGDVRAQLAQLELAFLDGRADELDESLERLGAVIADAGLRAGVEIARGHLRERRDDRDAASASFGAALVADGHALAGAVGAIRTGAGAAPLAVVAEAVEYPSIKVGYLLEAARRGDAGARLAAASVAPHDATVQAVVLDAAVASGQLDDAVLDLVPRVDDPARRRVVGLWAAARLAPDDPRRDALYEAVLAVDPDDELAATAQVTRGLARGDVAAVAAALVARVETGHAGELHRVRAATLLAAHGDLERAGALVPTIDAIDSPAAVDAWADVLGAAGRAAERGALLAAAAARVDDRIDPRLWVTKAATALDRAADPAQPTSVTAALDAWLQVIELGADVERAQARTMVLAAATGDAALIDAAWTRAGAAAESPAAAATLALARARIAHGGGASWDAVDEILHEIAADDPRRHAASATLGAAAGQWSDVALAYEDRAAAIAGEAPVAAALVRFRAAGLYLDRADDPVRAASLLGELVDAHPGLGFLHDGLATARRRLGDAAPPPRTTRADGNRADGFARLIRDAEQLHDQGDSVGALALLGRALEVRPHDPLAAEPLKRVATAIREASPITALALAELRLAEDAGDLQAKADAYEALARVDASLRDDRPSALISIEAAAAADPSRMAMVRELERAYAGAGRWAELAAVRERQLTTEPAGPDRTALAMDRALLLERLDRPEDELRAAYQAILADAPRSRRALFHLESLVRRGGTSPELAALEDAIAEYFVDDARTRSAFLTRGGETLAELGRIDDALAHFRLADELRGGYPAALEGWRDAALRGQLWIDFADAAAKGAALTVDATVRARLWHLAGVALMDRALASERAIDALREVLAADPLHLDAFVRLRLLLEEQGEHEELAALLETRLEVEPDPAEQAGLHRAIAVLARNFLEDRDRAKFHFRAIVAAAPNDLRAIAALSDIAWEQGAWGEAAEALVERARLEHEPNMLRNIQFRLGMIYADRLPDPPAAIRAFQRVLAHDPDDEAALERLADLGIATGEWRMALGACERLVKNETAPDRKVAHLHRVGRIFAEGFADRRKAERAYQLAVDAAPDSDVALSALIRFYEAAGDAASIRVHLGMVAAAMRQRVATSLQPSVYRVLARVARARHDAGVAGQGAVHRAAVDIARMAGAEVEAATVSTQVNLAGLLRPEADELVWPAAVTPGLRQMVNLLGDRLPKHVGIDLRPYGVTRGDRLRARDNPVAAAAQEVAEGLGLGEIDVYVSSRQPFAMVAEPTSPLSLIIGQGIADGNRLAAVRFAATGALRLAAAQLSLLGRLPEEELGVLVVALLRLFQPDLPYLAVDSDQVNLQLQRLRRLIPSSLLSELRPHALGINPATFDHRALHRGLEAASIRAGLVAAGGAAAPLAILLARAGAADLPAGFQDPAVTSLIGFALSEDFAALTALCQS